MGRKNINLSSLLPYLLVVCGVIGLLCSFILTVDAFNIAKNPHSHLNCNLNPVISCGSVITSKESEAFSFPNPFLGLAAFAALLTIGTAMLAGATFKRWFWLAANAVALGGVGFIHWLFYESVYSIGALCPYCMVVWVITIVSFMYITLYNIGQGFLPVPARLRGSAGFLRRHHLDATVLWLLVLAALVLQHFWYYYGKYL